MSTRRASALCLVALIALGATPGCRQTTSMEQIAESQHVYHAHCAICHGDGGAGDGELAASAGESGQPPRPLNDAKRLAELGRAGIARSIETGAAHLSGSRGMPVWGGYLGTTLSGQVADYVLLLPDPPAVLREARERYLAAPAGATAEGRVAYVHYCSGCHGPYAGGDAVLPARMAARIAAPALADSARLAAKSDEELRRFISTGGGHAEGAPAMPGWINTLSPAQLEALAGYLRVVSRTASR